MDQEQRRLGIEREKAKNERTKRNGRYGRRRTVTRG